LVEQGSKAHTPSQNGESPVKGLSRFGGGMSPGRTMLRDISKFVRKPIVVSSKDEAVNGIAVVDIDLCRIGIPKNAVMNANLRWELRRMFLIDKYVVARQFGADQFELDFLFARRNANPGFKIQNRQIANAQNMVNAELCVVRVQSMHNLRLS
jgi:hypothetical protein